MNIELNADWSAARLAALISETRICLTAAGCSPEMLAYKCRDVDSGCPLECDVPFDCPFGYRCSSVTAADWLGIMHRTVAMPSVMGAVSRCLRSQRKKAGA